MADDLGAPGRDARRPGDGHRATLARSVRLLSAFRREQSEPEYFYDLMARDTVALLGSYARPRRRDRRRRRHGLRILRPRAGRRRGALRRIDHDLSELTAHGVHGPNALVASALALPFRTGSADVCFSSNVLEHVPDPWRMAARWSA